MKVNTQSTTFLPDIYTKTSKVNKNDISPAAMNADDAECVN